jgi:chemotaxis regulatin CheY-phosphate phosphatase CheZ
MTAEQSRLARLARVREADATHERMMQEIAALARVKRRSLSEWDIDRVVAKHGTFPKEATK